MPRVFALPFTHSLCPVTAYSLQDEAQSLRQGTWGLPSLSYLALFLPLCQPPTPDILAVTLTLCFCPVHDPDISCPLAHNPSPGCSSHLKWVSWGLQSHLFTFPFFSYCLVPRKYSAKVSHTCQSKKGRIKYGSPPTIFHHHGGTDRTTICLAHEHLDDKDQQA